GDLHDEVSGTVTGIVYFADAVTREIGNRTTPSLEKLLSLISESAASVQDTMSDIIWSVTPENDSWEVTLPRFRRYASDLCESKGIRHHIEIPSTLDVKTIAMERRRNLWLVYKEMVTNAVKHSGCSELSIRIGAGHRELHLEIADNGKGFDPDRPNDRHGLRNIRTRVAALKGEAVLNTAPGEGTVWTLTIPLQHYGNA
ncbi:MAG TPA: ATP-binding protein, partial [Bacteroidota bacterium]|nr:ATP-binding protein [Bacteroidota bacterium]